MKYRKHVLTLAVTVGTFVFASGAYAISPVLKEMEDGFVRLHEMVRPCVVNIDIKGSSKASMGMEMDNYEDLFRFFGMPSPEGGGPRQHMRRMPMVAQGSGIIYDKEGHIVTNNHVVEGADPEKGDAIKVKLWNDKEYDAKVVGRDPDTDLAVIKIEPDGDLPVATLGDSANLKVGQFAIAVGSARGFEGSFSFGHVSALGRDELMLPGMRFQNFIQTDAAINLGNSGGPLCNLDGEVIGMSVAIVYGANSLGFAIPVNTVKDIVPTLISAGKITRGYLGVQVTDVHPFAEGVGLTDDKGAFIKSVQPGTPAEAAQLRPYDVIRKVNGEEVKEAGDLVRKISALGPGVSAKLEVWREKQAIEVEVKLDEYAGSLKEALKSKDVLGLRVRDLTPEISDRMKLQPGAAGVVVVEVEPESPAGDTGIMPGDVINEVGQVKVNSVEDFNRAVSEKATPGKSLLIGYLRAGSEQDITVIKVPKDTEEQK